MFIALWVACGARAGERAGATPMLPAYRQECGGCHVAYPPGLLPAASWRRLLGGLPQHFGSDASLDAATVKQLATWLETHAGVSRDAGAAPAQDRITRTAWFVHEHGEVPAPVWKRPAVGSAANCTACHARADQGDFDEHRVRIPH